MLIATRRALARHPLLAVLVVAMVAMVSFAAVSHHLADGAQAAHHDDITGDLCSSGHAVCAIVFLLVAGLAFGSLAGARRDGFLFWRPALPRPGRRLSVARIVATTRLTFDLQRIVV